MGTTLSELRRKVLMGFTQIGGEDILMAEEAINSACHAIAEVHNFSELVVYDTTNAVTVDGQKRYHLVTDWGLTRPKDIISLVLHDDFNSRKLDHISVQTLDKNIPYPEGYAEGKSEIYTKQGDYVELVRIPDAAYPVYVRYYQWPLVLTTDTSECSYTTIDSTIIALARDIFIALKSKMPLDYIAKARGYVQLAVHNDNSSPDDLPVARGFNTNQKIKYTGEYWNNPLVKRVR